MKSVIIIIFIVFSSLLLGTETVTLKKKATIKDGGENFYFKYPSKPLSNDAGYIILKDQNQILIFNSQGKFIKNVYKKGEGPGEIKRVVGIWLDKEFFIIFNSSPGKAMKFSFSGDLLEEKYYKKNLYKATFLLHYQGRYYFYEEEYSNTQAGATTRDTKVSILSIDDNGQLKRYPNFTFPKKYFMSETTVMNIHFVQFSWNLHSTLFFANNGRMELKALDLKNEKILPVFKSEYKSVDIKPEWRRFTHPRTYKTRKKYFRYQLDDILRIRSVNNKVWLFTSNFDDKNLIKVKVVKDNGDYLGTLKVAMPKKLHLMKLSYLPLNFHKNKLIVFEDNDDGELELSVYNFQSVPNWAR